MTTYLQGSTAALVVQWREYAPDGPLVAVNNQTITITPLSGGAAVVGPTAVGITNPAVGVYVYNWAVPAAQTAGLYLVEWDATDTGTGDPVSASEIVTITASVTAGLPYGLCEAWDPIWCGVLPTGSEAITGNAVVAATEVLWAASGRQFGLCQETLRPCRRDCFGGSWPFSDSWWEWSGGGGPRPLLFQGAWYNITCGSCPGTCSCTSLSETVLPGPVYDIVQVKVDGVPLDPAAYTLWGDKRTLTRVDGSTWPVCNDLNEADTEVDTWSVTARFGQAVPVLGQQAVGELALEMTRACLGEDCRLPKRVQQLVRQGVTTGFPESMDLADRLYWPNLFITTYNPRGLPAPPMVYDVDGPNFRRTTT